MGHLNSPQGPTGVVTTLDGLGTGPSFLQPPCFGLGTHLAFLELCLLLASPLSRWVGGWGSFGIISPKPEPTALGEAQGAHL